MARRWRIFGDFCVLYFSASRVQHVSDMHPKFALRPQHVADNQSATVQIRQGKKKDRYKKKPQDENIMSASATQGGHKY